MRNILKLKRLYRENNQAQSPLEKKKRKKTINHLQHTKWSTCTQEQTRWESLEVCSNRLRTQDVYKRSKQVK